MKFCSRADWFGSASRHVVIAALTLPLVSPAALATDRGFSKRFESFQAETRSAAGGTRRDMFPAPDTPVPGVVIGPDTRFLAEGFIGTGYDSNLDTLINADGGAFGLGEVGAAIVTGPHTAETTALVRGSFAYHDIEVRPERWDVSTLIDHYRVLNENVAVNVGGFYVRDDIDTDPNQRISGYVDWAYKAPTMEGFARTHAMRTEYLADLIGLPSNNRLFSRDRTFDHNFVEQSFGVLIAKDRLLAPFFQVGYANLNYFNQTNTAVFNRDGDDVWAIGGVRVNLTNTLHVDLGARFNERWLQDPNKKSHATTYFDGKLVWTPTDRTYFEIDAERFFSEPIAELALFTESTVYSALVVHRFDDATRIKAEIGYIEEDQIGVPDLFRHIYGHVELAHRLEKHTELFGAFTSYNTVERSTNNEAERYVGIVGLRFSN